MDEKLLGYLQLCVIRAGTISMLLNGTVENNPSSCLSRMNAHNSIECSQVHQLCSLGVQKVGSSSSLAGTQYFT